VDPHLHRALPDMNFLPPLRTVLSLAVLTVIPRCPNP
jgi:hypothetical protein